MGLSITQISYIEVLYQFKYILMAMIILGVLLYVYWRINKPIFLRKDSKNYI